MKRERLIRERTSRGWTQADVAKMLGITTSYYGMIEQGARIPRLPLAFQLERLFGLPASALFPDLFSYAEPNTSLANGKEASADA